jgi:hypothetical protein
MKLCVCVCLRVCLSLSLSLSLCMCACVCVCAGVHVRDFSRWGRGGGAKEGGTWRGQALTGHFDTAQRMYTRVGEATPVTPRTPPPHTQAGGPSTGSAMRARVRTWAW